MEDNCDWCGGVVNRPPSHLERSEKTFCSLDCQGKWESKNKSGADSHNWNGGDVLVDCAVCSENRKVRPSVAEERERFFCSHDCYGEWRSNNVHSENHPQWKEEAVHSGYRGSWDKIAGEVRSEYPNCQNCGMGNDEHENVYGFGLHVHHIEPYMSFDDPNRANQKENLVPLCVQCHREVETEELSVSSPYK